MSPALHSQQYNVVILPLSSHEDGNQTFQLSAGRRDGQRRLVSPPWSESQIRTVFAENGTPDSQVQELFRGNRMANGGRDSRKVYFQEETLLKMGLSEPLTTMTNEAG